MRSRNIDPSAIGRRRQAPTASSSNRLRDHPWRRSRSQSRLHPLVLTLAVALPAHADPVVQADVAITDDKTPVMIDVLANDHGSGGLPMLLEAVRATGCPATVSFHADGTLEVVPETVQATAQCQIEYDLRVGGLLYTGTVDLTVSYTDGQPPDTEPPEYLGVPTAPRPGCVKYNTDPPSPPDEYHEVCCWHELLRAIDGQQDLNWDSIDALKTGGKSANQRLLCRAADYYSQNVRPPGAGFGVPDSGAWLLNDLNRMALEGWMDDGRPPGSTGHRGSNEILSPLYGTWHAAAYIVALERARTEGAAELVRKLEGWLRTYWVINALTAHPFPIREATTQVTESYCDSRPEYTVQSTPGAWLGLSVGNAGQRNLGSGCNLTWNVPARALTGIFHPGHVLTALALDWSPRDWAATGLDEDPDPNGQMNYHWATRTVLLLEGQDFLAAGGGSADLPAARPPASRFGLTEHERTQLRAFVAHPTADPARFDEILGYVTRDDPWRPFGDCPMTFVRTTEGTLSRFGTDSAAASEGDWLRLCNYNKTATFAAAVYNDGTAHYLSPGRNEAGPSHQSQRIGNQIVAQAAGERRIDRPGGEEIYRVEWSHQHGMRVTANFPDPPIQAPYGGVAHPLPGRLEAEHYDEGGSGLAYFDSSPTVNTAGNPFRPEEGVDAGTYPPAQVVVTDVTAGEWLEYTVDLAAGGDYALSVEYRSQLGAGELMFEIVGTAVVRTLVLPRSDAWRYAHRFDLDGLAAGEQVIRLTAVNGGFEIDGFQLSRLGEPRGPYGGTPTALPGVLEVEHYDEGDPGDAYDDGTPWSIASPNPFRTDDWVDATTIPAGTVVSWIDSGEWLEYTVEFAEEGEHEVDVIYLSGGPGTMRISVLDGPQTESTLLAQLPGTDGQWRTESFPALFAGAGTRVVRLDFVDSYYSVDYLRFHAPIPPEPPEPPQAVQDYVHVPRDAVDWEIPHARLIENDTPEGAVVEWDYASPVPGHFFGSLSFTPSAFLFTPPAAWHSGPILFYYRIRHPQAPELTDLGRVSLLPTSSLPVAHDDTFEVLPGATVTIYHSALLANDEAGAPLFAGVESLPEGPLEQHQNHLVYTAPATPGVDRFTYRLGDAHGNQAPAPATVTLILTTDPSAPVANDDHFFVAKHHVDGRPIDSLAILYGLAKANDSSPVTVELQSADQATCGHLAGAPLGWNIEQLERCDLTSWTYSLFDPFTGRSDSATVTVDVVPEPAGTGDAYRTDFQRPIAIPFTSLLANDDGFGLGLVLVPGSLSQPSPASAGTIVVHQDLLSFLPAAGFSGDVTFTYQVRNDMAEHNPISVPSHWDVTSAPIPVVVTVDPPDAAAAGDTFRVGSGLSQVDLPFAGLFANDQPPAELEIAGFSAPASGQLERYADRFRFLPDAAFWSAGGDQFTYTVRRVGGTGHTSTAVVRLEAEQPCAGGFAEPFETRLAAWDEVLEVGGSLSVVPEAAMQGALGLRADLGGAGGAVRLGELSLEGASHPMVSFFFDPNSLALADGQNHPIAAAGSSLVLFLSRSAGQYRVRLVAAADSGLAGTPWVDLADRPQRLLIEALAPSGIAAADGMIRLWIDDFLRGQATGLDNRGLATGIRFTRLGNVWGLGASGTYFFDDYRSCQGPGRRQALLADGFEASSLEAWSSVVSDGFGEVSVTEAAAVEGGRGLAVRLEPGDREQWLGSDAVHGASHLLASFLLDAAGLSLPEGHDFYLFGYVGPGGWRHHVRLGYAGGVFRVRQIVGADGGNWSASPWFELAGPGSPQRLAVEWWQASQIGADDGGARLAIDGVIVDERLGVDNDEQAVTQLRLGAAGAVDPGTAGTFHLDSVQAWMGDGRRRNLLLDDFESTFDGGWLPPVEVGGSASIQPEAALNGWQGLEIGVTPDEPTTVELKTEVASGADHVGASFLFDPATLAMPEGQLIYLFGGTGAAGGWPFHLRLRYSGGGYRLRLVAGLDGGGWTSTVQHALLGPGHAQRLGVEWWRSRIAGDDGGGARLSIDGVVVQELAGLDNDQLVPHALRLGALALVDAAASGAFHIDNVQFWTHQD